MGLSINQQKVQVNPTKFILTLMFSLFCVLAFGLRQPCCRLHTTACCRMRYNKRSSVTNSSRLLKKKRQQGCRFVQVILVTRPYQVSLFFAPSRETYFLTRCYYSPFFGTAMLNILLSPFFCLHFFFRSAHFGPHRFWIGGIA